MPKPARNRSDKARGSVVIAVQQTAFDPGLASLFASSSGPVQAPPKSRYQEAIEAAAKESTARESRKPRTKSLDAEKLKANGIARSESGDENECDDEQDEQSKDLSDVDIDVEGSGSGESERETSDAADSSDDDDDPVSEPSHLEHEGPVAKLGSMLSEAPEKLAKKRKRANKDDDLEDSYMRKLAQEEIRDEEKRKKQRLETHKSGEGMSSEQDDSDGESFTMPKHETLQEGPKDTQELDKAQRTVFLSNVSNDAITTKSAKHILLRHLASFIPDLADHDPPHKVESIRFRSTAFASALPKKAAFAKKEIMNATTKSTNAYVIYSTKIAAREAAKQLNGTVVLKRHLRVDSVAHPAPQDHRRCVFVGNLGFVDDESSTQEDDGEKKKKKPPSDVEEGLWQQFKKAGKVESVRVVRDPKTRVGKGFAYVQFEDENGVEAALEFNDQKFPPLLPRKLRVVRAKKIRSKVKTPVGGDKSSSKSVFQPKKTDEQKSREGRARAMLGKAGAFKSAESFVFEGHRASSKQGTSGLKLGGKKKRTTPSNRTKKRAAAYKAAGGRKPSSK
ncbi:hypothetical protein EJ04DRAFT_553489 [Polyplosphaeria fusca]|uniref:Nucleolar protein 12 n=1 Tax=Polyplosphaeria fusca TaxID=682080 RepID=A0A9P4QY45_9PLEO|nr:hypothetical protein EJ04DRAFT_553489 [Polyplosphaeria fusca]